jgi:site-specific DNA-methyltransferase (adenine-specific)
MNKEDVSKGFDSLMKYKVMISKMGAEHAGEPSKDGMFRVLTSTMRVLTPNEVCTHSYFVIGPFDDALSAENLLSYLQTKFVRFLIMQCMSAVNLSKAVFAFVPLQDFSKPWTDEELYKKYGLTDEEIQFIESMIRPME